ncbi:helix-turn-helix transcriptional regulator [Plantactinospora sp. KLBMP9567]|uniref:helix-turn-helix transcriptional regulator n=1 Tax=Plantactinospora sp. KLBMP9567 TaxID=3085900 RepID=UPI0029820315|nr:LuxR C-terminal-related transcriptional regulator [Plantactinospora sp. KLBMP9567]MDW5329520.1 LuxR C-terminal-related transcriptional regulator [Plantactinospora sp. KLBMP9567]
MSSVQAVHNCDSWERVESLLRGGDVNVLILHESEASALTDDAVALVSRSVKVLVLFDDCHATRVFERGLVPDGLLMADDLTERSMTDALRRVAAGEIPMPTGLTRELIERASGPPPRPRRRGGGHILTPREMETLALLAEGLGNKQIARRLHISSHGVKRIVASLLLKLGSPNRTTAVVTAVQMGLIKIEPEIRSGLDKTA